MIVTILFTSAALAVGIMSECDDVMNVWMKVFASFVPICACCYCFAAVFLDYYSVEEEEEKNVDVGCGIVLLTIGVLSFHFGWLMYGCVLFWPNVATNHCQESVVVSIKYLFKIQHFINFLFVFCFFCRLALSSPSSPSLKTSSSASL